MPDELVTSTRRDVLHAITMALLACRYEPPRRRKSAWHVGYQEDLDETQRCAVAIADALDRGGYHIFQNPPGKAHST